MSTRLEHERLRRMREAWREDAPSEFEVVTAVGRSRARQRSHRRGSTLFSTTLRWGGLGAALGIVAALSLGSRFPTHGTPIAPEALDPPEPTRAPALSQPLPETEPSEPPAEAPPARRGPPRAAPTRATASPATGVAEPSEPAAADSSGAARWLAIGRGSDAGSIVVGLPKAATSAPTSTPVPQR